jgi:cytidine deaminase
MIKMDIKELKNIAERKVNPRQLSEGCYVGSVASALLTDKGNVYVGVCIDTSSSMGFCAEHSAIAQMITNEESKILKIVAVGDGGKILPPCGRCREFIYQINNENIETEILVEDKIVKLKELLPYRL